MVIDCGVNRVNRLKIIILLARWCHIYAGKKTISAGYHTEEYILEHMMLSTTRHCLALAVA